MLGGLGGGTSEGRAREVDGVSPFFSPPAPGSAILLATGFGQVPWVMGKEVLGRATPAQTFPKPGVRPGRTKTWDFSLICPKWHHRRSCWKSWVRTQWPRLCF